MTKTRFDVMLYIHDNAKFDAEEVSASLFIAEGEAVEAYNLLVEEGYVYDDALTEKGNVYLEEHRIENAVILAAGTSSRFVPLNFEIPKSLLKVKGEVLIERQIRQMREKGIDEIVIVVGYMKEKFEYLTHQFGVKLIESHDYLERNNHASVFAAKEYLGKTIVTNSDLYFVENIFQKYAFDAYYSCVYQAGKTAERGIVTDSDNRIIDTFYGDRCHDLWVTLGYAYFNERFSKNFIRILSEEFDLPATKDKFWADIQDEHLDELYMYAKKVDEGIIYEFDSLEELREFDDQYLYDSGSYIMKNLCKVLAVKENNIIGIERIRASKKSLFRFRCKGEVYLCDVEPDENNKITFDGRVYYQCRDFTLGEDLPFKLYRMDKGIHFGGKQKMDVTKELTAIYDLTKEFDEYHKRALPLCAAENIISTFANLPLAYGFQERYIMNNTYSFNMDDNFIGCEKLFPFYQKLSEACERVFGAKYTDPRPFTGMHCIDMVTKTVCKPGDKMMILSKEHGGHASVKPVVERLDVTTIDAPYILENYDLDYDAVNSMIREEKIDYILLAPSDIIKPLDVEKIDTTNCVLLWDCSQILGLIAAGLCPNPLKKQNVIMFAGTHKTFPGPASGLILTNDYRLHCMMETEINPKFLRHSQMHQKISLLFSMLEFEQFGAEYMSHMVHCSNYLGERLKEFGFDVADCNGRISETHQIFIRCSKEEMDTIYDNAYKCEVTLNKKKKALFYGYGIRLGTQEIARYDWGDEALDLVAVIVSKLASKSIDVDEVKELIGKLPPKIVHYTFDPATVEKFKALMLN